MGVYCSTKTEQQLTNEVLSNGCQKKPATKKKNSWQEMCVGNHSSNLRQPDKYVCGVVMNLGNSSLCVLSKFSKSVLSFTVCAVIGKPKDRILLANFFQSSLRVHVISLLILKPWTCTRHIAPFFIES